MQNETNRKVFLCDGTYRKVLMDGVAQAAGSLVQDWCTMTAQNAPAILLIPSRLSSKGALGAPFFRIAY